MVIKVLDGLTCDRSSLFFDSFLIVSWTHLFIEHRAVILSVRIPVEVCSSVYSHIKTLLLEHTMALLDLLDCRIITRFAAVLKVDLLRICHVSRRRQWVASCRSQMVPVVIFNGVTGTIVSIPVFDFRLVQIWTWLWVIWRYIRLVSIELIARRSSMPINWVVCFFLLLF